MNNNLFIVPKENRTMMSENNNVFQKDPQAIVPFSIDWGAEWLENDSLRTGTWSVPSGLSKVSESYTSKVSTVVIGSGTAGQSYEVVNRIISLLGYTDERSISIFCLDK